MKHLVAAALAKRVVDGQCIGLGSGTTVEAALLEIGKRIAAEGLKLSGVPSSHRIGFLAEEAGMLVVDPVSSISLDWAFDGADEVDPDLNLIKGGGGALLGEKIIAERAGGIVVIVTEEKLSESLGARSALPVEVVPQAIGLVRDGIRRLGATSIEIRQAEGKYGPVMTEHNNVLLDVRFPRLTPQIAASIKSLTGVVEHGLFCGLSKEVIIARSSGLFRRFHNPQTNTINEETF